MKNKGVSRRAAIGTVATAGVGLSATAGCASESPAPRPDGGYSIPASRYGVSADASPAANAQALQRAIDASYGRRLVLDTPPGGVVRFDRTLIVEPAAHGNLGLEICGFGANGYTGSVLQNVGGGHGIDIVNRTGGNWDGPCVFRAFGLHGDIAATSGGSGIHANRINGGLRCEDLWMEGHAAHALHFERCYGMEIERGFFIRSRLSNIRLSGPSNNVVLRHVRSFSAGRLIGQQDHANIDIVGTQADRAAGVVIDACDVSYAGQDAGRARGLVSATSGAAMLSLPGRLLRGGERIAMTSPEFGTATSLPLVVNRDAAGTENAALDCGVGACPQQTANGPVFPFASGLRLRHVLGVTCIGLYAEDCAGAGVEMEDCQGFSFIGGLLQDSAIRVAATATHGTIAGICFRGERAGIRIEGGRRSDVQVEPSNAMLSGARLDEV